MFAILPPGSNMRSAPIIHALASCGTLISPGCSNMRSSLTIRSVTASRYSRAPAFLLERAGGRKQGALGRPGGGAWRKDSGAEIEPSSVEPDSETGKF